MTTGSEWGNPRSNQIKASYYGDAIKQAELPAWRIGGWTIRKARTRSTAEQRRISTELGDTVPDDVSAEREFTFTCGLMRAITLLMPTHSDVQLYLDGYVHDRVHSSSVKFLIDSVVEEPTAELWFEGYGPRYGTLHRYKVLQATLRFKDEAQMKERVMAVALAVPPKPDTVVVRRHVESGGSGWLLPFAAGAFVGSVLDGD